MSSALRLVSAALAALLLLVLLAGCDSNGSKPPQDGDDPKVIGTTISSLNTPATPTNKAVDVTAEASAEQDNGDEVPVDSIKAFYNNEEVKIATDTKTLEAQIAAEQTSVPVREIQSRIRPVRRSDKQRTRWNGSRYRWRYSNSRSP